MCAIKLIINLKISKSTFAFYLFIFKNSFISQRENWKNIFLEWIISLFLYKKYFRLNS